MKMVVPQSVVGEALDRRHVNGTAERARLDATRALIVGDFATLVSSEPEGLVASHVPVLYDTARGPKGTLIAHLARANPHGPALDGAAVLAVFHGPHGYVSPSWYATQPSVPTWNYAVAHVHGHARLVTEAAAMREIVARLVAKHESHRPDPWSMDGLPAGYVDGMLRGIVGVEIPVTRIEAKHKLSQNRSPVDRQRVIATLEVSADAGDRALGAIL